MTDRDRDPRELPPEDDALVRRLAEIYAPPPLSAERRVAWRARLDERLARSKQGRRAGRALALLAGAAAASLLAAWLALPALRGPLPALRGSLPARAPQPEAGTLAQAAPETLAGAATGAAASIATTPEDALLGLTRDAVSEMDAALPADYVAIESLLL